MKKIIFALSAALWITACGPKAAELPADQQALMERRTALKTQMESLASELQQVEEALSAWESTDNLQLITAHDVTPAAFEHYVDLQGDVTTQENILIYPELAGTLLEVRVKKGQQVSKGQVLARIDAAALNAQVAALKAATALAKTTYDRQSALWKQNIGSEIQYLQAKTNYSAQKGQLDQLESTLAKAEIRAPFSGIIDELLQDPGTVVAPGPGSALFRLINLQDMYVAVDVPERYIGQVKKGDKALVVIPVLGDTITSAVRETGNYIAPSNRSFSAEIAVPNSQKSIKPNLNARVLIRDYQNPKALMVPLSILSENAQGEQYLYVVGTPDQEGITKAEQRTVTTGLAQGNLIEITSGLNPGELVVLEGSRKVRDGQKVKVIAPADEQ
ncbi:MAG TPA: efflux RND transporter periplasmic adaptor subunit [Flavobacteriaceae bacterium]|jgi:membrane fusion protein (multidrug efflux system)|nr:efflux RND transporter periplasmic adaptor subunit [Flavobacteriaceae bacterium]